MSVTQSFVVAGKAIFTLEVPAGTVKKDGKPAAPHYTYAVEHKEAGNGWPEIWFVYSFTGTDNEADSHYTYMGKLDTFSGQLVETAKTPTAFKGSFRWRLFNRIMARVWGDDHDSYIQFGYATHHEGRCGRCGHRLTTPLSVETGIGPECCKIMGLSQVRKTKTVKAQTAEPVEEVIEASDSRGRYLLALADLEEHRDSEGEVVFWTGKHEGRAVRVFND